MAPGKQSLLPAHLFVKCPSRKFQRKHQKLVDKFEDRPQPVTLKIPAWKKKKMKQEEAKKKEEDEGAQAWDEFLEEHCPNHIHSGRVMFLVNGRKKPTWRPNGEQYTESELDTSTEDEMDHFVDPEMECGDSFDSEGQQK